MAEPLILLTNDDGIHSPGLKAAAAALLPLGKVLVIAPTEQQTAMGRSLWGAKSEFLRPLDYRVNGTRIEAYHSHCSPAQIVLHGVDVLCGQRHPDLLVAGINYGENLGYNVTLSGTIGAAFQAAAMGIPALAVSLQTDIAFHYSYGDVDWTAAGHFTRLFSEKWLSGSHPPDIAALKIDVPGDATAETPWRVTRVARQSYYHLRTGDFHPEITLGERETIIDVNRESLEHDSDIHALLADRCVSVTPLSLDITSRVDLTDLNAELGNP